MPDIMLVVACFAQFIAVCSASILAEELRISSPFSSQSHENRKAALRHTCIRIYQLQPTTKSDKVSDRGLRMTAGTHPVYNNRWC